MCVVVAGKIARFRNLVRGPREYSRIACIIIAYLVDSGSIKVNGTAWRLTNVEIHNASGNHRRVRIILSKEN